MVIVSRSHIQLITYKHGDKPSSSSVLDSSFSTICRDLDLSGRRTDTAHVLSLDAHSLMANLALVALSVLALTVQAQTAPNGYTLVADNDYIDAGPLTNINQTIVSLQACANACDQDPLCQSIKFSTYCTMYRLRRCMTPPVHNNAAPISDKGQIYEKNIAIPIPDGSQIVTICGNYSGPVLGSYTTLVPAQFGPTLDGNVAAFTTNCSQTCGSNPNCRSWRVLEVYENNPNVPVILECTWYGDSIYDVPKQGFYSTLAGVCKRASSIYAIKGPALSRFNCTGPGTGTIADPVTSSPSVATQNATTTTDAPAIITAPSGDATTAPSGNVTTPPTSSWAMTSSSPSGTAAIAVSSVNSSSTTVASICPMLLAFVAFLAHLV